MVKNNNEKEREHQIKAMKSEKKLLISFILNCANEVKLLLTILLIICSLLTLLQFFPTAYTCLTFSSGDPSTPAPAPASTQPEISQPLLQEKTLDNGVVKRSFNPVGTAAYNFILMSAYRGGAATFAVMGLSSKPLHVFSNPTYTCEYQANDTATVTVPGYKILPDWGYGRVYTTVVVNCTFPTTSVAADPASGGRLLLHAATNGGFDNGLNLTDTVTALVEPPGSWDTNKFVSHPKYDFLYCGSSLYGDLSPQRVREWIAYHARLFGNGSHIVFHDAGGVHPEVMEVVKPWIKAGYVTVHDIREQERFDGYYHNQFLVVNDCLHRYKFDAKWIFFFDVDEFVHINPTTSSSLISVMDSLKEYTQISIEQMPMSNQLCLNQDAHNPSKKWGLEKLVYADVKRGVRRDRKYAVQPRNVFATGVHLSQHLQGKSTHHTERLLRYYHYHGTIAERHEPCRRFINDNFTVLDQTPYLLDKTLRSVAPLIKRFELETIGSTLQSTRQ